MIRRIAPSPGLLARTGGVVVLLVLAAGCGRGIGNLTGTVRFNGKPLPGGTISFYDAANAVHSGEIKEDGAYEVKGVVAGEAKIAVEVPLNIGYAQTGMPTVKVGSGRPLKMPTIPGRYRDPKESGLRCQVAAGDQIHNVDMTP